MTFSRTPATESSMIYGVALLLGFLFLAAFNGWGPAIALSQWLAVLLLLPSWIFHTLCARFVRFRSKYRSFFVNISVISVVSILALVAVQVILSSSSTTVTQRHEITNVFGMLVFVYFLSSSVASAVTQWVFLKNSGQATPGATQFGALPSKPRSKKKS